jgi:WD40 repeat protein
VAHHYSLNAEKNYQAMPKATISPDGKLIMFSSNMNDADGRVDVFAVEVPLE